jgi:hypothetical protein
MAKMAEVSEITKMTARHVIVGPVAKKSELPKMSMMTARHVICSLGGPAV